MVKSERREDAVQESSRTTVETIKKYRQAFNSNEIEGWKGRRPARQSYGNWQNYSGHLRKELCYLK